jgi:hypothetical protein
MRLSKYEKETIILTSEGDDTVQIQRIVETKACRICRKVSAVGKVGQMDSRGKCDLRSG